MFPLKNLARKGLINICSGNSWPRSISSYGVLWSPWVNEIFIVVCLLMLYIDYSLIIRRYTFCKRVECMQLCYVILIKGNKACPCAKKITCVWSGTTDIAANPHITNLLFPWLHYAAYDVFVIGLTETETCQQKIFMLGRKYSTVILLGNMLHNALNNTFTHVTGAEYGYDIVALEINFSRQWVFNMCIT